MQVDEDDYVHICLVIYCAEWSQKIVVPLK